MSLKQRCRLLNHYFFASYVVVLVLCSSYLTNIQFSDGRTLAFTVAAYLSYGFIYLLPALLLTKLLHRLLSLGCGDNALPRGSMAAVYVCAIVAMAMTDTAIFADRTIYALYGFHLNGFVWNLLMTPGGIDSLGGSRASEATYGAIIAGFFLLQAGLLWALGRLYRRHLQRTTDLVAAPKRHYRLAVMLFLLLTVGERVAYGISHVQAYTPVLVAAQSLPLYTPTTFRRFAKSLGYEMQRQSNFKLDVKSAGLAYPLNPIAVVPPEKPLNIVWLVAESWRYDMLNPEIMPATWDFAQRANRFTQHYSGGNGTRMGMYTMFYGLYGAYWFPFLDERRTPVIMDQLQQQNYQLSLYTSAKFSYPEFDKTLFAKIPQSALHDDNSGVGWKNDRRHVGEMIDFIKARDPSRPFMTFMFFESPHARYYFPQESVIRPDYLEDFNYATMDLERDIDKIFNRYVNSNRHLDSQFKRLIDYLEQEKLLDNTVVVMTGDHGEEFMEKGRWGHNSEFSEEQIRVPLVIWVPGSGASTVDRMTSHLDIPATLMPMLGVSNPAQDYSLGYDLFGPKKRDYTIVSEWSRTGYIDADYKASFPLRGSGLLKNRVTTRDDLPVVDESEFYVTRQAVLLNLMQELGRFSRK